MKKKNCRSDWREKMFLLQHHEDFHTEPKDYFHNGDWFILEEGLEKIKSRMSEPKIETERVKRKLCLLCGKEEFQALSYRVKHWDEYTPYYDRDRVLILPAPDYFMLHYEIEIPFDEKKEKAIIETIEKNVPKDLSDRSRYYAEQAAELHSLKAGFRKCGGHFLLCPRHNNGRDIETVLHKMIEVSYCWKREHMDTPREYFHVMWPIDWQFLMMHYRAEDILIRANPGVRLSHMIRHHAGLHDISSE